MAGLVSRLIIFSVSPFTCNAHRKHFNYDGLQKNCPDCQNILTDMTKFHDELRKILREDETARLHFIYNFPLWISTREDSITSLKKVETELNKTKRDVNISNIVGSSAGIVGGVVAVVGLALAPLTAGVSLGLSIGGASLGTAGGLTAGGQMLQN
ncbi:apolipoprotein L3-like [Tachypleus tridentatus]|uniref:apolipoprotein L3-like n=1 Tax=Tachypleus tridentatus TaxID=6853 RepID=UPI003FD1C6E8